jgi:hypothetical protein
MPWLHWFKPPSPHLPSLKVAPSRPRRTATLAIPASEPRAFPEASTQPTLPPIADEMLELYAFIFCQGGSRRIGMTFEQFLLVAYVIKAPGLFDAREDASTLCERQSWGLRPGAIRRFCDEH